MANESIFQTVQTFAAPTRDEISYLFSDLRSGRKTADEVEAELAAAIYWLAEERYALMGIVNALQQGEVHARRLETVYRDGRDLILRMARDAEKREERRKARAVAKGGAL